MEIKKIHWIGIIISMAIILSSLFLIGNRFFFFVMGMGILIGAFPFVLTILKENRISAEKEEMFLEFSRNSHRNLVCQFFDVYTQDPIRFVSHIDYALSDRSSCLYTLY